MHTRLARPVSPLPARLTLAAGTAAVVVVAVMVLLSRATVDQTAPSRREHPAATEHVIRDHAMPLANAPPALSGLARLPERREPRGDRHPRGAASRPMSIAVGDAPQIAALPEIADLALTVDEPAALRLTDLDVPDLAVVPLDSGPKHEQKEMR